MHLRINAIGDVDELNASIGFTINKILKHEQLNALKKSCLRIQNQLFNLGSQLAVLKEDRRLYTPIISQHDIDLLEREIDHMNDCLPTLVSFILPGGRKKCLQDYILLELYVEELERAVYVFSKNLRLQLALSFLISRD